MSTTILDRRKAIRKRSAAITLLLAGGLAGCSGEPIPQRDAYRSLADCQRDWSGASQCSPVRDNRYASSYYYGPSYFGSRYPDGRPKPSPNAMDVVDLPKGTQVASSSTRTSTSTSSLHSGSSTSTTSSSSSSTRSGFGSTSSAHGSSSS